MNEPLMIQAVVVGGVAAGTCIKIRADAAVFELSAPEYVKPLESAHQIAPEVAKKRDVYELHPIEIVETREKRGIMGIAVLKGNTLTWAYQQLIEAYAQKATDEAVQESRVLHS